MALVLIAGCTGGIGSIMLTKLATEAGTRAGGSVRENLADPPSPPPAHVLMPGPSRHQFTSSVRCCPHVFARRPCGRSAIAGLLICLDYFPGDAAAGAAALKAAGQKQNTNDLQGRPDLCVAYWKYTRGSWLTALCPEFNHDRLLLQRIGDPDRKKVSELGSGAEVK